MPANACWYKGEPASSRPLPVTGAHTALHTCRGRRCGNELRSLIDKEAALHKLSSERAASESPETAPYCASRTCTTGRKRCHCGKLITAKTFVTWPAACARLLGHEVREGARAEAARQLDGVPRLGEVDRIAVQRSQLQAGRALGALRAGVLAHVYTRVPAFAFSATGNPHPVAVSPAREISCVTAASALCASGSEQAAPQCRQRNRTWPHE